MTKLSKAGHEELERRLGNHYPTTVLGSGALGIVYATKDPAVAVKISNDPSERIFASYQKRKQLPGIVKVHNTFAIEGNDYIVRERVEIVEFDAEEKKWLYRAAMVGLDAIMNKDSAEWREFLSDTVPARLKTMADTMRAHKNHIFADVKRENVGMAIDGTIVLFDLGGIALI